MSACAVCTRSAFAKNVSDKEWMTGDAELALLSRGRCFKI